jgi:hypothetical protein
MAIPTQKPQHLCGNVVLWIYASRTGADSVNVVPQAQRKTKIIVFGEPFGISKKPPGKSARRSLTFSGFRLPHFGQGAQSFSPADMA